MLLDLLQQLELRVYSICQRQLKSTDCVFIDRLRLHSALLVHLSNTRQVKSKRKPVDGLLMTVKFNPPLTRDQGMRVSLNSLDFIRLAVNQAFTCKPKREMRCFYLNQSTCTCENHAHFIGALWARNLVLPDNSCQGTSGFKAAGSLTRVIQEY